MSQIKLGDSLPVMSLKNELGEWVDPGNLRNDSSVMFMMYSPECRYTQAYASRISALYEHFHDDDVRIYFINLNPDSTFDDLLKNEIMKVGGHKNNFLNDSRGEALEKFLPEVTPEVFVFDRTGNLSYKGAIDNDWEHPDMVTRVYLEDALEYTLDAIDVDFPETIPVGTPVTQLVSRESKHQV